MINLEIEPIIDDNKTSETLTEEKTDQTATIITPSKAENSNPENEDKSPSDEPIISLKNVDIYQKKILILSDISFSINKGEMVYVVGKTGSGKSNLLKLLYGDVPLLKGELQVAGYNLFKIKSKNIQRLRRKLGIVFQDFQLLFDRNVYENLKFVTKVTGWKDNVKSDERIE
jgi:cell division transport system ATP-binding protein